MAYRVACCAGGLCRAFYIHGRSQQINTRTKQTQAKITANNPRKYREAKFEAKTEATREATQAPPHQGHMSKKTPHAQCLYNKVISSAFTFPRSFPIKGITRGQPPSPTSSQCLRQGFSVLWRCMHTAPYSCGTFLVGQGGGATVSTAQGRVVTHSLISPSPGCKGQSSFLLRKPPLCWE